MVEKPEHPGTAAAARGIAKWLTDDPDDCFCALMVLERVAAGKRDAAGLSTDAAIRTLAAIAVRAATESLAAENARLREALEPFAAVTARVTMLANSRGGDYGDLTEDELCSAMVELGDAMEAAEAAMPDAKARWWDQAALAPAPEGDGRG